MGFTGFGRDNVRVIPYTKCEIMGHSKPDQAFRHSLIRQRNLVLKNLILGPKSEALNPKSETISNVQIHNSQNRTDQAEASSVCRFGDLKFEFVSDFDIRISSLTRLT